MQADNKGAALQEGAMLVTQPQTRPKLLQYLRGQRAGQQHPIWHRSASPDHAILPCKSYSLKHGPVLAPDAYIR